LRRRVIQQQGDEGELWHRTLIDPTLLRVLGPLEGRYVLDLACGNGYYTQTPEVAVPSSREPRVYSPPYILGGPSDAMCHGAAHSRLQWAVLCRLLHTDFRELLFPALG
jgi:hypothetical protein